MCHQLIKFNDAFSVKTERIVKFNDPINQFPFSLSHHRENRPNLRLINAVGRAQTFKIEVRISLQLVKGRHMALTSFKKVFSLVALFALVMLHFSFNVASVSVKEEAEAEIDALLKWKANLQSETQPPLPSWTLLPNNATNSSMNQNTSSSPCSWFGISCNQAESVTRLNLTNSSLKGTLHAFPFSSLPSLAYVDLSMNELFGTVPFEISHLSKLKSLICPLITFRGISHHRLAY